MGRTGNLGRHHDHRRGRAGRSRQLDLHPRDDPRPSHEVLHRRAAGARAQRSAHRRISGWARQAERACPHRRNLPHTWRVHEGTATYCANAVARAPAIPHSYAAAEAPFRFIDDKNPHPWMRLRTASLIARRACQTAILDSWFEDSLWDLPQLQRHLSVAAHDPDLRLDSLLDEVAHMDDADIASGVGAEGHAGDPLGLIWLSEPDGLSVVAPQRPPELAAFVSEFAADIVRRGELSSQERARLEHLTANPELLPIVYAAFPAAFSLAVISGSGGAVASGDPRETMCASRLLVI